MLPENHNFLNALKYSESKINSLREICTPLFESFPIKTFSYTKINSNDSFLYLSTNQEWLKFRYEHSIWGVGCNKFRENIATIPKGGMRVFVWAGSPPETKYFSCLYEYDIWNGGLIVERSLDSIDVWGFTGGKGSSQSIDFFLNNTSLIYSYILYIKDKAHEIINISDRKKLIEYENCYIKDTQQKNNGFELFIENLDTKRFFLDSDDCFNHITKRESDCLHYYMQGYTTKETAAIFGISNRTVEFYIENAKLKLNCSSKAEIRKKLLQSFLKIRS